MNPNQGPNQEENPFADILQNMQQQRMQQMAPQGQQVAPPANGGNSQEAPQPITAPGVANATTQSLIAALSQLNNFIKGSQDREDIEEAQVVISLLSRLIQKDRTAQANIQQVV